MAAMNEDGAAEQAGNQQPGMARTGVRKRLAAGRLPVAAALFLLAAPAQADSHATGDPAAGEEAFARQCVTCHMVIDGTGERLAGLRGRTGPNLYDIALNPMAGVADFRYGASMIVAREAGLVWTEENFVGYVMNPTAWLREALDDPGARAKMTFRVRKEEDARDIYAYLAALVPDTPPETAPETETTAEKDPEPERVAPTIPVSFASDQADRGEKRYERDCQECHGDDLKGGLNGGAPIRGLTFEKKYFEGAPASLMFEFMSTTMPPNSPGRYSASTYADLMAYVLKRNGVRSGAPLPSDLDALDRLIMDK